MAHELCESIAASNNVWLSTPVKDDYTFGDELGRGAYGKVLQCTSVKTGAECAVKIVNKKPGQRAKQQVASIHLEVAILNQLHHGNILQLFAAYETGDDLMIVTELMGGGEMFAFLAEHDHFPEAQAVHYLRQALQALEHTHSLSIMHLDIKPENLMLCKEHQVLKLIDFGLAREYNPARPQSEMLGTPEFVAPEVCNYDALTPACDVWAVGVISYILITGYSPFLGDNDSETLCNVSTGELDLDDEELTESLSKHAKLFIKACLQLRPGDRPTAKQCLKHPWLTETNNVAGEIKTEKLRKFNARRRWAIAVHTVRCSNSLIRTLSVPSKMSSQNLKKVPMKHGGSLTELPEPQ